MGNQINNKNQILFDFKLNKSYLDQDYYLSSSNQEVYNLINSWPKWIKKTINLYGEKFSGKSHLASIFEKKTTCVKVLSEKFSEETIQDFKTKQALIIEDLDENFSDRVKKRIDRVAPLHATRMGPAIRHTTSKLVEHDAKTKLLFLLSDGRPQDRGYSREGVEKEYAVHDTKMALDEAKAEGINAFCLTVDKNGHDYLKTMCEDIGYEVLDDINTLPERLLVLYRRLTM